MNKAGFGSESGSISHMHGSADPDPHQNVMDPQQWCKNVMQAGLQLRIAKTVRMASPFKLPITVQNMNPRPTSSPERTIKKTFKIN